MSGRSASPEGEHRKAAIDLLREAELCPEGFDLPETEALVEVLSYFVKYLMVWDRNKKRKRFSTDNAARLSPLKRAAFERRLTLEAVFQLNSAPWLSKYHDEDEAKCLITRSVVKLLSARLIRREWRPDIFRDSSVDDETRPIPVIQLCPPDKYVKEGGSAVVAIALGKAYELAMERFESRRGMLMDLGYGAPQVGPQNMRKVLNEIGPNSIVKIAVYSGRTVFDNAEWVRRMSSETSGVQYRILALGITVHSTLLEGAELASYRRNVLEGILSLRDKLRKMPKKARKRCQVRLCGHSLKDAFFRGFLVEDPPVSPVSGEESIFPWRRTVPGAIKRCQATCWRFQDERGTYGEIAIFGEETNLAELARHYFDEAFDRAIPLNFWGAFWYPWRKLGVVGWSAILSTIILLWFVFRKPDAMEPGDYAALVASGLLSLSFVSIMFIRMAQMRPFDRYELLKYLPSRFIRKTLDGKSKIGTWIFPELNRRI